MAEQDDRKKTERDEAPGQPAAPAGTEAAQEWGQREGTAEHIDSGGKDQGTDAAGTHGRPTEGERR